MLFAIIGIDRPDTLEARLRVRDAHLARLEALKADGRLALAGPMPSVAGADTIESGCEGSLIIADFPSLSAAQEWAFVDPYVRAGVYGPMYVKPWMLWHGPDM